MKLDGKGAFISGSAGGIGRGIALAYALEGATVVLSDINEQGLNETLDQIKSSGGTGFSIVGDVSDGGEVNLMINEARDLLGHIDILVNCAGVSESRPFLETTEEQWDRTVKINLKSIFLTCQAVLPKMIARKSGIIINLSSQSGKRGASWYADYCATKFGIIGLTQSLAQEYAYDGIRINSLCPGVIQTNLWNEKMWMGYAHKKGIDISKVQQIMLDKIPMGRFGIPEDVARVAVFLASDDSSYMTGQSINITGGSLMG